MFVLGHHGYFPNQHGRLAMKTRKPVVVLANRLPIHRTTEGWEVSPGGLVTALSPVLEENGGTWIGWTGEPDEVIDSLDVEGISCVGVPLSKSEIDEYYLGFCNKSIWPLYHNAIRTPEFHREWWRAFVSVNERFAEKALARHRDGETLWIHDYHLQLVPDLLRDGGISEAIKFFLHIPFPPVELFARLPWRRQIVTGLLGADLIGFQTRRCVENFKSVSREFADATVDGNEIRHDDRATRVVAAPISIDTAEFERIARLPSTERRVRELRSNMGDPRCLILGADRLDYTKGIDVRLRAFETLLETLPGLAENVVFVQVAVPSRQAIGDYATMRDRIELIAGRINGMYGKRHRMPVHYLYESLSREDLVAYYRAADVMMVTPLADGMNLVAKEFVASRVDSSGVLMLSQFAGAADELEDALIVNPFDIDGVASRMSRAIVMHPDEARRRMERMRAVVRENDVHAWTKKAMGEEIASAVPT